MTAEVGTPRSAGGIDPWLLAAVGVGLALRLLPLVIGSGFECLADECDYLETARALRDSGGSWDVLLAPSGPERWVWAPGYPVLVYLSGELFGSFLAIRWVQLAVSLVTIILLHRLTLPLAGLRAARIAAALYAVHPTLVFFSGRLWPESLYASLLVAVAAAAVWSRDGGWWRGAAVGALAGACVLLRGVATYALPIFALAVLWPAAGETLARSARRRWRHGLALVLAAGAVVAPYSLHASRVLGGFVVSDLTLGRMMWLGNNDFPPATFDWGNGWVPGFDPRPLLRAARPPCAVSFPDLDPVSIERCERRRGLAWIAAHPGEFLRRIPLRWAQLLNPHSFLTRQIRMKGLPGAPAAVADAVLVAVVLASVVTLFSGVVGACAWARGPYGVICVLLALYQLAAVGVLAGMTRYRVPLVPLWIPFAAALLAAPAAAWRRLRDRPGRGALCALCVAVLLPLTLWFLPAGFTSAR